MGKGFLSLQGTIFAELVSAKQSRKQILTPWNDRSSENSSLPLPSERMKWISLSSQQEEMRMQTRVQVAMDTLLQKAYDILLQNLGPHFRVS